MRDRHQPRSNRRDHQDPQPTEALHPAPPLARQFSPSALDIDDLAEAIRLLLEPGQEAQSAASEPLDSDLLSAPDRSIHVVEAADTP